MRSFQVFSRSDPTVAIYADQMHIFYSDKQDGNAYDLSSHVALAVPLTGPGGRTPSPPPQGNLVVAVYPNPQSGREELHVILCDIHSNVRDLWYDGIWQQQPLGGQCLCN
jgi:hypothetical protein